MSILCSISTRGRYHTSLPHTLIAVANQTKKPSKIIVYDDNEEPIDVRTIELYRYIFQILEYNGIHWEWLFAEKKGQHYNHDKANRSGYEWVWRLDDDTIPEPNVLESLYSKTDDDVGAVGGSILTPPHYPDTSNSTGLIENLDSESNIQWNIIRETKQVEHLHCSFLYRTGIAHYDLRLSKAAHREETLFTYDIDRAGYKVLVTPAITWHIRNEAGGIRQEKEELFAHDEQLFRNKLNTIHNKTVVVLDCGMGDHIIYQSISHLVKNPVVFTCYPEIVPGRSIAEAQQLLGSDLILYNPYYKLDQWNWKESIVDGFKKMYVR